MIPHTLHPRSLILTALLASIATAQITPGNLVVTRVGDGTAALSNASTAVFLDQYTTAGLPGGPTIAMPIAAAGANMAVTNSGSATSEGFLTQSVDGRYLISVGYGTAPGTVSISGTTSVAVNRVVARTALDGTIDSSTALTDAYSGNTFRSASSVDGSQFWTSGTATAANGPGVRYAASLGATTSTQLSTTVINIRVVNIFAGQLYCSSASGAFQGVSKVGTGLPVASGETITLLPGFPTATGPSSYDFFLADATTLYVADDRTNGLGGIQKWTEMSGTWSLQYTLALAANVGCRGVTGCVNDGITTLYATTTNNNIIAVTDDMGPASVVSTIVTGVANTAFRGIRFVRTPASITHSGTACATSVGVPIIGTSGGDPVTGNLSFAITASNTPFPSIVLFSLKVGAVSPIGFPVPGTPACVLIFVLPDVLASAVADPMGNASVALPIPARCALGGTLIGAQAVPLDFTLTGFSLPVGSSDAMQIVIGN
ncbi:MAG: hypothetical protein ABIP94_00700 [Planctomycetota bacterium]